MKRLPTIASALTAVGLSVLLIGVAVTGFTETEKRTITQLRARIATLEATDAAQTINIAVLQDSVDGIIADIDTLMANDLTLASDVDILDAGLKSIVADDGPLAQIDSNLAMTQAIVFAAHPPIALTDITPLVACNGTTCTVDIEWNSDPPATGQVEWGLTAEYGNLTTKQVSPLAYHKQRIGSFAQDGTTYHFRVLAEVPDAPAVSSSDTTVMVSAEG